MSEEHEAEAESAIFDAVLVKEIWKNSGDVDFSHNVGSLSLIDYGEPDGKCVVWRQCELTVETEDPEWAVVQDSKQADRTSNGRGLAIRPADVKFKLSDLKSFEVSKNHRDITLSHNDNVQYCCFSFQHGSTAPFVNRLKSLVPISECRSKRLYLVMDQPEVQSLNRSFAELELFPDDKTDAIWSFMRKFHKRPLETTMGAFAKVTDVLYRPYEEEEENVVALLTDNQLLRNSEEYEVVSPKIPLPPRTLPPRIPCLSEDKWRVFFDDQGRIMESEIVKEMILHGGIEPSIRKEVWKFLLDYYPWNSTFAEREIIRKRKAEDYFRMKLQWKTISKDQEDRFSDYKERKNLIEKDVTRTDRSFSFYGEESLNLQLLQDILMTYVMYNFDLGYVQGMNDLLSPLLYLMRDEVDTFWCYTTVIKRMIKNFDIDQAGMKEQLQQLYQLLSTCDPELADYLHKQESSNMFFCFRWLLVWFKREFTYDDIYILWETLWAESTCLNYHLILCLAILDTEKETLISKEYGFTEILKHINELSNNINLTLILRKAEGIYLQLSAASDIPNATRAILGLPLVPEPKEEEHHNGQNGSVESSNVEDHQVTNFTSDMEDAYENSISFYS